MSRCGITRSDRARQNTAYSGQLYYQLEDWEIIEENNMNPETYYMLLEEIQEAFVEWQTM